MRTTLLFLLGGAATYVLVGAISITYQDIRDARFRKRHGLHPYWRTHERPR